MCLLEMSRLFWSRNFPINCSWDLWFVSAWIWLKSLAICGTWIGIQMYPVFEISFFDASRDSRQLKDQVPTLPHNSFGNAPCMVSLAVNIGELAYGEAMVHHCSETQAAHVVTLFKLVTAEFETSPGQLTFYCQYPSIINSSMAYWFRAIICLTLLVLVAVETVRS